jgi:hypothetical protein
LPSPDSHIHLNSKQSQLTDLAAFLRRSLPRASEAEVEAGLVADYSQDLVVALLDRLAPEPPPQGALAAVAPANLRPALRELATRVMGFQEAEGEDEGPVLARLWKGCNPAEILLHLKVSVGCC